MFNINKLLNRISDQKVSASPTTPPTSPDPQHSRDEGAEGFLCPSCMRAFPSAEALQDHYETNHIDAVGSSSFICPACKMRVGSEAALQSHFTRHHVSKEESNSEDALRQDLSEMDTSLKEERWYTEELKKEISRLQDIVLEKSTPDMAEQEMLRSQVKALEEGKALLMSEVVLMRQQLGQMAEQQTTLINEKEQGDRLKACAALEELEREHQNLKMEQVALQERCTVLQEEKSRLEKALERAPREEEIESLKAALTEHSSSSGVLQGALEQHMEQVKELREKLKQQEDLEKKHRQELGRCTEEMQRLRLEVEHKCSQLASTSDSLNAENMNNQLLNSQLKMLQAKMEAMESENLKLGTVLVDQRTALERSLQDKEAENASLLREQTKAAQDLKEKVTQLCNLHEQLEKVKADHIALGAANDGLKKECWEKEMEVQGLKRQLDTNDTRIGKMDQETSRLKDSLSRLEAERDKLYAKIEAGEGSNVAIQQLKEENALLVERVASQERANMQANEDAQRRIEDLHRELQEASTQLQMKGLENERLCKSVGSLQDTCTANEARLSKLESNLHQAQDTLSRSEVSKAQLQMDLDKCKSQLEEKAKDLEGIAEKLQKVTALQASKSSECRELEAALTSERQKSGKLQSRCGTLDQELSHKSQELATVTAERSTLQLKLEESAKQLNALQKKQHEITELKKTLEGRLLDTDEKLRASEKSYQETCRQKEEENAKLQEQVDSLKQEAEQNIQSLKECKCALELSCSQLEAKLEDTAKHLGDTHEKAQHFEAEAKKVQAELEQEQKTSALLKSSEAALRGTVENLTSRTEELDTALSEARAETDLVRSELAEVNNARDRLKVEHESVSSRIVAMELQLEEYQALCSKSKRELEELKAELETSRFDVQDLTQKRVELSTKVNLNEDHVAALQNQVRSLSEEKDALEGRLREERASWEGKAAQLSSQLTQLQKQYTTQAEQMAKEVTSLKEARQLLIEQKVDLQGSMDALRAEKEEERTRFEAKEKQQHSENLALRGDLEKHKAQLEAECAKRKELSSEWERERERLEARIGALSDNLDTFRTDLTNERHKREAADARVDQLYGDKLELEAKLENTVDERRALLDRCLGSEAECDQLRKTTSELRKRLDDSEAALQELGWENQALQVENARHQGRKWADDSQVANCMDCQKLFTLTIRKHHCRNCGNIFCNECSSKSATIPSSKRPVRVCNVCYTEVTK